MVALSFTALGVVTLIALLGLSAFFSSSETAIFTLPEEWVAEQAALGDGRLAILEELQADPHRLLVTILVGNNVVNVAIASITTVLLIEHFPPGRAVTIATVLASFVVLIFGEIVPKSYGIGHAKEWAVVVARPLSIVERVGYPLVLFFDVVTRYLTERVGGEPSIEQPYLEE